MSRSEKFLAVYSGLLTAAFAVVVLTGASATRNAKFDEIDVQRINVREADGTLRLVLANNGRMPGGIFRGKESVHPNQGHRGAGLLFYNDEGTEVGGLTFDGEKGSSGKGRGGVHLSFDQYEQDQVLVLANRDRDGKHSAGLTVSDRPEEPLVNAINAYEKLSTLPPAERDRRFQELVGELKEHTAKRLFIGKNESRAAVLEMKDAEDHTRLRLRVEANGDAKIEFLDADGKVQRKLTPEKM